MRMKGSLCACARVYVDVPEATAGDRQQSEEGEQGSEGE